ncbi:hypothetical protein ABZ470_19670 [Streptosporangium sp. NPDC020072]|uniref:hypothetical protein n=1 Tax=Streptosporangium sp. NPDC020072 TaxID=3154788 RepID=UPI00343F5C62
MNTREPDWAYAAKSLLKVLSVSVLLFLALNAAEGLLARYVDLDDERLAQVYGTVARVANPDKRLSDGYSDGGRLLGATYTLTGEPRRAGHDQPQQEYEITEDLFGTIRAPSLSGPSGALGDAITAVETNPGADDALAEKTRKTVDALPKTLETVAVVEFTHAMTTEQLIAFNRKHRICAGADVSYVYDPSFYDDSSFVPRTNAIVWNRGMLPGNSPTYQCEAEPATALAEFRRWTGLLHETDDLQGFGLTPYQLTGAAEEGVVHALLLDRWKLAALRELLDDPEVRTAHLTDAAFDLGYPDQT